MGVINSRGPAPVDLSLPTPVDPKELRRRIDVGEWVIDLRSRTAFAAGHLAGTMGFELSGSFVAYLGWLYTWGAPLTLIGDDHEQILDARRELARIGVDNLTGSAAGDIHTLAHDNQLRSYRVADFADLAKEIDNSDITVLDVRRADEYVKDHITNAINIALHELPDRIDDVPTGEVWVHCASGYRSSIAASLIDQPDRTVVLIDDKYAEAQHLELTT
jgi:rhodanese-related sulfurtransferase